jgi:hypothetical protein
MAIGYPLINGRYYSWPSAEIRVAGTLVYGITEINYSIKLDPGIVRGAGSNPTGFTLGNAEYEGDFTILLPQFTELMAALGEGAMTQTFDIVVSYSEDNVGTVVDTIQGCRITGIEAGASNGSTDAITRKCSVKMLRLLNDGTNLGPPEIGAAT